MNRQKIFKKYCFLGVATIFLSVTFIFVQPLATKASKNIEIAPDTGDKLGVGTKNPGTKLDVAGSLRVSGPVQLTNILFTGEDNRLLKVDSDGTLSASPINTILTPGKITLPSGTSGQTLRHTGSSWVANSVIYNNGTNVGIGRTSPTEILDVKGNLNVSGLIKIDTRTQSGFVYPYFKYLSLPIGTAEAWYKISVPGYSSNNVKLRISISGDNTISNDEFIVSLAGYSFKHHITHFSGTPCNSGKILEIKTNNPEPTITEIWIRVARVTTSNGALSVYSTLPIPDLVAATPSFSGTGIASMDLSATARKTFGVSVFRGVRVGISGDNSYFGGNVGIGTTSTEAKLAVSGGNIYINDANITSATPKAAITKEYLDSAIALLFAQGGNSFNAKAILGTNDNNALGIITNKTEKVTILANGNVGIGTTSPQTKLDVAGIVSAANNTFSDDGVGAFIARGGNPTIVQKLQRSAGSGYAYGVVHGYAENTTTGLSAKIIDYGVFGNLGSGTTTPTIHYSYFAVGPEASYTNTNLRLYNDSYKTVSVDGRLGVGTQTPAYKLDVNGTGRFTGALIVPEPSGANHAATKSYVDSTISGGSGSTVGYWTLNGTDIYNSNTTGKVGIGIAAPAEKLQVNGNIQVLASASSNGYLAKDATGTHIFSMTRQGNNLSISANSAIGFAVSKTSPSSAYDMYIQNSTGYVGIGTTAPGTTLELQSDKANPLKIYKTTGTGNASIQIQNSSTSGYFGLNNLNNIALGFSLDQGNAPFQITSAGNVGIGVTNPGNKLELVSSTATTGGIGFGTDVKLYRSAANTLSLGSGNHLNLLGSGNLSLASGNINLASGNLQVGGTNVITSGRIIRANNGSASAPSFSFSESTNAGIYAGQYGALAFSTGGTERLVIDSAGRVGVGTTPGGYTLSVAGTGYFTVSVTSPTFSYASDLKLKTNIKTIQNPLDKIIALRGVSFDWKDSGQPSLGLIAQEVEEVFPELVKDNGDYKTVEYGNLVAPLIEAVKEQQQKIEELEAKIINLESNR